MLIKNGFPICGYMHWSAQLDGCCYVHLMLNSYCKKRGEKSCLAIPEIF